MSSVPPVWRLALKLTKSPKERTLEQVHCGSAPLSGNLWKEIMQWTGTNNVLNAYVITETGSWVDGTTLEDFQPDDGLIGKPWGAVIKVLKSGTTDITPVEAEECKPSEQDYIWINTPALMQGYFGRDDLTNKVVAQGWFLTGDIGLIDDRGLLYLRGRERDEINKGGMKIFPSDIDAVVERLLGLLMSVRLASRRSCMERMSVGLLDALREGRVHALTVTSSEGVDNLCDVAGEAGRQLLSRLPVFAPHPRIAARARSHGLHAVETGAGDAGLIAGLLAWAPRRNARVTEAQTAASNHEDSR